MSDGINDSERGGAFLSKNQSGVSDEKVPCPHNVIRRSKDRYPFAAYVCGSCAQIFEAKPYTPPEPIKEPMFDRRPPWGFRDRQA